MSQDVLNLVLSVVSVVIVMLIKRYFKTEEEQIAIANKVSTYWKYAYIAVLYTEDIFKNDPGKLATVQKVKHAAEYLIAELAKLGFVITTEEAEGLVRAAYQDSPLKKE